MRHVADYAGHMADGVETVVCELVERGTVDLDAEMCRLTLRVIGRSVFGTDLGADVERLSPAVERTLACQPGCARDPGRGP